MLRRRNDLLKGPVLQAILLFALPLFLSNMFQQLYNMVDTVIVGNHLGELSLAAIGASMAVFQLLVGFTFGFGGGFGIVVARCFGSGDDELLKKSVAGALVIGFSVVVFIMLIAVFFLKPILILLKTPPEIVDLAHDYIYIITIFVGVMFAYNLVSGLLRAIGNSFVPLLFLIFSSILNIALDIFFVIVLEQGIKGAAIATVIAQGISAVLSIIYVWKKEHELIPERRHFKVDKALYKDLFGQGLSMAMMFALVVIGTVIIQYAINQMGYLIIAGHTTARRILSMFAIPLSSLGLTASTFISQNKGANHGDRIIKGYRYSIIAGIIWCVLVSIITWLFSEDLVRLISGSTEPVVLETGSQYLVFNIPMMVILSALFVSRHALQGLGEKIKPLISSIIELIMKIVFVAFIIPVMGYKGVIISEPVIWVFMTAHLMYAFYTNTYIKKIRHKSEGSL